MVSFAPRAGGRHGRDARARAIAICEATRLFTLAESLGGVESLIEIPAVMTHMSVAGSVLEVDQALIRLSVGIEAADDLVADLRPTRLDREAWPATRTGSRSIVRTWRVPAALGPHLGGRDGRAGEPLDDRDLAAVQAGCRRS